MSKTSTPTPSASPAGPGGLFGPAFFEDPYALYAALRRQNGVFKLPIPVEVGAGVFLLTRYADVQHVLRDGAFSVDRARADAIRLNRERLGGALLFDEGLLRSMLTMDPPDHTRVRGLVNKAFTPRRVAALRPRIESVARQILDESVTDGRLEVMGGLAMPLPAIVIAELLGVPSEDWPRFRTWAADMIAVGSNVLANGPDAAVMRRGLDPLQDYLRGIIAERRRAPKDDLLSAMVVAQQDRDALSDVEMLSTAVLLLIAGHETTTNLIGNGLLALLRTPDAMATLRGDRTLLRGAIEEMLRFDSPVQGTVRVAVEDTEVGGVPVNRGALLICGIGAANRDPEVFAEPDRFDPKRESNHHLSFGFGAHFCLGAPLARLEAEVAFSELLDRFPALHLDATGVERRMHPILRGLVSLPVHG